MVNVLTGILIALVIGAVVLVVSTFLFSGYIAGSKEAIEATLGYAPRLEGEWFSCLANCLTHITREEITPLNDTLLENEKHGLALLTYYPCQYDILRFATTVSLSTEEKRDRNLLKECLKGTYGCSGTATPCGNFYTEEECTKNGCSWYSDTWGGDSCEGPDSCGAIVQENCDKREGCEWRVVSSLEKYSQRQAFIDEYEYGKEYVSSLCPGKCLIKGTPVCNGTYEHWGGSTKQVILEEVDLSQCNPYEECDAYDPEGGSWQEGAGGSLCFKNPANEKCYRFLGIWKSGEGNEVCNKPVILCAGKYTDLDDWDDTTKGPSNILVEISKDGDVILESYCIWNPHLKACVGPTADTSGNLILNYTDCKPYCPEGWFFDGLDCVREECIETNQYREAYVLSCLENRKVNLFEGYDIECSSRNFYDICNYILYHASITIGLTEDQSKFKITKLVINSSDGSTVNKLDIGNIKLDVTDAFGDVKAYSDSKYDAFEGFTFDKKIDYSLSLKSVAIDGFTYSNIGWFAGSLSYFIDEPITVGFDIKLPVESYLISTQYYPCSGPESTLDLSFYKFKGQKYIDRTSPDKLNFICKGEAPYDLCYSEPEKYDFDKCWPSWEVLINKTGDCQDFALLSYTLFRSIGKKPSDMLLLKGYCSRFLPCPCQVLLDRCDENYEVGVDRHSCNPSSRLIINLRNDSTYYLDMCGEISRFQGNIHFGLDYNVHIKEGDTDYLNFDIKTENVEGRTFDFFELRSPPNMLKLSDIDAFCSKNGICFKEYKEACDISESKLCAIDIDANEKIETLGSEIVDGEYFIKTNEFYCTPIEENCEGTAIKNPTLIPSDCFGDFIYFGSYYLCGWEPGYYCYSENTTDEIHSYDCATQKDAVCNGWKDLPTEELIRYCEPLVTYNDNLPMAMDEWRSKIECQ